MMRTALISDSVSHDAPRIGRASLEASSADAHIPEGDGSWSCQQCTGDNKEWASRCVICNARQPVKYVGRKAAPQQRHQFVVPRPAQRGKGKSTGVAPAHKRVRQTDEGTRKDGLSRAAAVAHDQMEFDDCGDEEEALQATEGGDEEEEDDLFEHGASTTAPATAPVTAPFQLGGDRGAPIELRCAPGLTVILGSVASGKSALLNASLGEMSDLRGAVSVRGRMALCPQTPWIFNASLRDNVLFGAPPLMTADDR
jgi:hypothetical protein